MTTSRASKTTKICSQDQSSAINPGMRRVERKICMQTTMPSRPADLDSVTMTTKEEVTEITKRAIKATREKHNQFSTTRVTMVCLKMIWDNRLVTLTQTRRIRGTAPVTLGSSRIFPNKQRGNSGSGIIGSFSKCSRSALTLFSRAMMCSRRIRRARERRLLFVCR